MNSDIQLDDIVLFLMSDDSSSADEASKRVSDLIDYMLLRQRERHERHLAAMVKTVREETEKHTLLNLRNSAVNCGQHSHCALVSTIMAERDKAGAEAVEELRKELTKSTEEASNA